MKTDTLFESLIDEKKELDFKRDSRRQERWRRDLRCLSCLQFMICDSSCLFPLRGHSNYRSLQLSVLVRSIVYKIRQDFIVKVGQSGTNGNVSVRRLKRQVNKK